jgi:hypothetical protein
MSGNEIAPKNVSKDFQHALAEKYGFNDEAVEKMVSIYPAISLRDFFKDTDEGFLVAEVLQDKGKQPIPAESSNFPIKKEDIVKIVVDGETKEVVMKPVLILKLLSGERKDQIVSRIPSASESTHLLKIEYSRAQRGLALEGAVLKFTEKSFEDRDGVMRDGYSVEEVSTESVSE